MFERLKRLYNAGKLDAGACGNGLKERDVVLKIGRRVENYLRAVDYDVMLAQITDFTAQNPLPDVID